ncbi:MAG: hypothetical protein COA79_07815 [Planctomycetota bacterium]|nr:MAG: hypothetical protein COA79_07815 [Planctomycetota bacterium]
MRNNSGTTQLLSRMYSNPNHSWKDSSEEGNKFSFILANDYETRQSAYRLANSAFQEMEYVDSTSEYIVDAHDCDEDTFTLLVKNENGESIGTVSLYFDKYKSLPSDEVFCEEMSTLRKNKVRIAEVTRLAIAPRYRQSKTLISRMFNMMYLYAYKIMQFTDLVIEVKEVHAFYYQKLLSFEILGKARSCLRVNGTLANILHIKLSGINKEILDRRDPVKSKSLRKNIYNSAFSQYQENEIIIFFNNNKKPMSKREMAFYDISLDDLILNNEELELVLI